MQDFLRSVAGAETVDAKQRIVPSQRIETFPIADLVRGAPGRVAGARCGSRPHTVARPAARSRVAHSGTFVQVHQRSCGGCNWIIACEIGGANRPASNAKQDSSQLRDGLPSGTTARCRVSAGQILARSASTTGVRDTLSAGNNAASKVAARPTMDAIASTDGTIRMIAV